MHYLSNWFTKNPVAANLMMLLILVAGYLSFSSIRIEGFPKIAPDSVTISVAYPGASPEQMDLSVSQKIEKSLEGLPGTKRTTSFSGDSYGFIQVQKEVEIATQSKKEMDSLKTLVKKQENLEEKLADLLEKEKEMNRFKKEIQHIQEMISKLR
ncbi:MAG: efflux RND transporter permease subunit, partial [Kangiellaceae bacterium]|nr:efflux RND transporter permease subunit [Kangiellaceae bacterium]